MHLAMQSGVFQDTAHQNRFGNNSAVLANYFGAIFLLLVSNTSGRLGIKEAPTAVPWYSKAAVQQTSTATQASKSIAQHY